MSIQATPAEIIDGTAIAARVREGVARDVAAFEEEFGGARPGLATILVGDDPASAVYVSGKQKACREVGMEGFNFPLPADADEASERLAATTRFWRTWLEHARIPDHEWRLAIQRSALAIKGLTYMPTGATVAALTTSLPFAGIEPSGSCAVPPEFQMVIGPSVPPLSVILTVTLVDDPLQPARTIEGVICFEYVKVIVSPESGRPAMAPPLVIWMSVA